MVYDFVSIIDRQREKNTEKKVQLYLSIITDVSVSVRGGQLQS